ncbi:hypothetical protein OF820_08065 [Oceanotoga sp. DSM 15011]|uniref:Helix-turn-helix protein n=1 Tax=Oceanotoga teriensis TaxID=515440 RepID=A0AA45HIK8_9BACT|nr:MULTISPECIES: GntR family transcriptional regulator YhfZ [Oceanotoga]MDN5342657.1 hypothetical protein [Oceanotoga sp.]MDO7975981.1 hypothetical protein [Oceanotoga teriensis]PWJ92019.1 helix-turn-helix protein [Oceanotoga teriensis]UYO99029.1 hypothetical protein OF820_08065 [Oceanotoga sp. DSM 15011]
MEFKNKLMQKNGLVATLLAREFITKNEGERINTVSYYSEKFSYGRGTIQNALNLLKDSQAIKLRAKGHKGTFIEKLNYEILWDFTGLGTLMGVMPLPYSKLYEGLSTGLYKSIEGKNIPFNLAYMRGAKNRIEALKRKRYDFAVLSKFAALNSIKNNEEIEIIMDFGRYSYVNEHAMIFSEKAKTKIEKNMKVGIDKSSLDHYILTLDACKGIDVNFIDLPYNQILSKVINKEIDAAIWNVDEINERKMDIKYYKLERENIKGEDTQAVIVVNKTNDGIKNLLLDIIDQNLVKTYQKNVVKGNIIPNY